MNKVSGSCPFTSSNSVSIDVEQGGFQGVVHWADILARWLFSTSPNGNGGIGFFTDVVYDKETERPRDYVNISLAHKFSCGGFVHPDFWKIFNGRKGENQLGGEELDKVGKVITNETPLTKNDNYEQQRALKKLCTRNHFSKANVARGFPDIFNTIAESIEQSRVSSSGSHNLSEMIIQLLSRGNSVHNFGPQGSRSHDFIQELIHDPKWDQVAKSVEIVGKHLNEAVLFSPKYYATKGKEGIVNLVKLSGLVNESKLPKIEYQRHLKILEEATNWIREASLKGLASEKEAEFDKDGNPIRGIVELMYESQSTCKDRILLEVIGHILSHDYKIDPDEIVRALVLSPSWQKRIKKEMRENKKNGTSDHTELTAFIEEIKKQAPGPFCDRLKPAYTYSGDRLARVDFSTWTDEQITGMIRLILVVGQRTTAFTLEAAIRCLILHPEWQEKIYEEIQEKCPDGVITAKAIKNLKVFDEFVTEVYRLYPAVLIQTRDTTEDMKVLIEYKRGKLNSIKRLSYETPNHTRIGRWMRKVYHVALYILNSAFYVLGSAYRFVFGSWCREVSPTFKKILTFPKGTTMAYIHLFAQRHPDIFNQYDPHEFHPERFTDDPDKRIYVRNFSGSPSNCCGEWQAKEGTIPSVLLYLISHYVIGTNDFEKVYNTKIVGGAIATHDQPLEGTTLTPR